MRVLTTETPVKDNSCSSTPRSRSLDTLSTDGHPDPSWAPPNVAKCTPGTPPRAQAR